MMGVIAVSYFDDGVEMVVPTRGVGTLLQEGMIEKVVCGSCRSFVKKKKFR